MSKIHILTRQADGYEVIVHTPVPVGNNEDGHTWKEVLLKAGVSGVSSLTVGTGVGETTQAEMDDILAGDVIEFRTTIRAESSGATPSSIDAMVDAAIVDRKKLLAHQYKFYGYEQG